MDLEATFRQGGLGRQRDSGCQGRERWMALTGPGVDVMGSMRAAATVLVLVLIALGASFLFDALTRGNAAMPRTIAVGTLLCCLSLALLYLLGRRVEK